MRKAMSTLRNAALVTALLGLGARGGGPDGQGPPPNAPATVTVAAAPSPSPSRVDPGVTGCRALQALGTSGTAEEYRAVAAVIAATGDARLAAEAVRLHDATGTTLAPVATRSGRLTMLGVVLDVEEECLRVTG